MKTSMQFGIGIMLLLLLLSFFSCYNEIGESEEYGAEYTVLQKEKIIELAKKYGVTVSFVKPVGKRLATIEELEEDFRALAEMQEVYEVPVITEVISDDLFEFTFPKTRSFSASDWPEETGGDSDEKELKLSEGEVLYLFLGASWRVYYSGNTSTPVQHASVNISASISRAISAKGYSYYLTEGERVDPSPNTEAKNAVTGSYTIIVRANSVDFYRRLTISATIDLKAGSAEFSIG